MSKDKGSKNKKTPKSDDKKKSGSDYKNEGKKKAADTKLVPDAKKKP